MMCKYGKASEMHYSHIKFKFPLNTCILKYACTVIVCATKSTTDCDLTLCSLVEIYRRVRDICCSHLQTTQCPIPEEYSSVTVAEPCMSSAG
jgi:hypothetical protein